MLRPRSIVLVTFIALVTAGALYPLEAQLGRLRRAAENAVSRELDRQVDRAVTGMIRCAFNDPACIEKAKRDGQPVEITDEDGNVLRDANGNPISDPEYAAALRQKPGEGAWRNYDFVPGERILFHEDYANDNVGDFPRRLEFHLGNMEVVDDNGLRVLRVSSGSPRDAQFAIPLPEELPERFTLEFPVHWAAGNRYVRVYFEADGAPKPPAGGNYQPQHVVVDARYTGIYDWQGDGPASTQEVREIRDGWVTIRVMADGEHVKAYVNEKRVANVPRAQLGRDAKIWFNMRDATDEVPIYIGAITVAAGGRDLYDRLEAEGTIATRGILFALDSDEILPESTPTLDEIGEMLRDHPDLRLGITGHTDDQGSDDYNLDLSGRRAASVVRYLVEAFDIDDDRVQSAGKGETEPVDTNDTVEGRANNRRVELTDLREGAGAPSGEAAGSAGAPESTAPEGRSSGAAVDPSRQAAGAGPQSGGSAPGPSAAASLPAGTEGEITIVLGGATETLPVSGGDWDPLYHDDPEFGASGLVRFSIQGSLVADPDRSGGDPVSDITLVFNERTLEVSRGRNWVYDHRVTPRELENYVAAFDMPADSDLRFTIEEYEVRDGSGFVRGRFSGTDLHQGRSLTGTFEALVPGVPCRKSIATSEDFRAGIRRFIDGRMTADGCVYP